MVLVLAEERHSNTCFRMTEEFTGAVMSMALGEEEGNVGWSRVQGAAKRHQYLRKGELTLIPAQWIRWPRVLKLVPLSSNKAETTYKCITIHFC